MFDFFKSTPKSYEDVTVGEFNDLMLQKDTVIIDVRTPGEFAAGKLRGARNIDIMSRDFANQVQNLPKDKTYLLYCRSGNRSGQACQIMGEMGFKNLKNMSRGIMAWPFETV